MSFLYSNTVPFPLILEVQNAIAILSVKLIAEIFSIFNIVLPSNLRLLFKCCCKSKLTYCLLEAGITVKSRSGKPGALLLLFSKLYKATSLFSISKRISIFGRNSNMLEVLSSILFNENNTLPYLTTAEYSILLPIEIVSIVYI